MAHGWTVDGFFNLEWRPQLLPGLRHVRRDPRQRNQPGMQRRDPGRAGRCRAFTGTRRLLQRQALTERLLPDGETDPTTRQPPHERRALAVRAAGAFRRASSSSSIRTELGLYFPGTRTTTFINSGVTGPTPAEYSLKHQCTPRKASSPCAVSASTGSRNLTLSAQLTATRDYPTHYNARPTSSARNTGSGPFFFLQG
jgi:hypothetical protein